MGMHCRKGLVAVASVMMGCGPTDRQGLQNPNQKRGFK